MIQFSLDQNPWVESTWAIPLSGVPVACEAVPLAVGPTSTMLCAGWLDPPAEAAERPADAPLPLCDGIREVFLCTARRLLLEAEQDQEIAWHARSRLAAHGFGWSELAELPLGVITTRRRMFEDLRGAGRSAAEIRDSRLLSDPRLPGRIVGPICDPWGTIVSFWAREPDDRSPRHLFLTGQWRRIAPLVGLETALTAAAEDRLGLVVVEDPLDALLLHSHGLMNVAAIAGRGSELSPRCWQRLAALEVSRVTLVLNNEPGALEELSAARENHRQVADAPELFFVLPERLAPWTSPGELVHARDMQAFRALLEQAWRLAHAAPEADEESSPLPPPPAPAACSAVVEAPAGGGPKRGDCPFHFCGETDCFCFD
jgi:hypothetical protein